MNQDPPTAHIRHAMREKGNFAFSCQDLGVNSPPQLVPETGTAYREVLGPTEGSLPSVPSAQDSRGAHTMVGAEQMAWGE